MVAAAAWGVGAGSRADADRIDVPEEFTVDALKQRFAEQEPPPFRTMRDTMMREDLTDDQKRQIARNMRDVFRSEMQARVQEYFDAPPDKQDEILDRHLDEWQEMRKRFEAERRRRERSDEEEPSEEDREQMRRLFRPQSQQERKARSESRNPDERAQVMAYFGALRRRAGERGIDMGRGGRGGGPGRGGPRGGRGGRP
jgi:hypothetical protein